jgi:hypothetical protein
MRTSSSVCNVTANNGRAVEKERQVAALTGEGNTCRPSPDLLPRIPRSLARKSAQTVRHACTSASEELLARNLLKAA